MLLTSRGFLGAVALSALLVVLALFAADLVGSAVPVVALAVAAMATYAVGSVVKDQLGLSASALSKQVAALIDAGYVRQDRSGADSRKVWLSLTKAGSTAYRGHVAALQAILAQSGSTV